MASVSIKTVIEQFKLTNLTPQIDVESVKIHQPDINRPALQLAGYFEHFEETRPQIIGFVEFSYMKNLPEERKKEVYPRVISEKTPCIIFCRDLHPDEMFMETALKNNVPLLMTEKPTSAFMAEIIRWLNVKLAPCISVHGVLVDVYGEGVLITGESGIGKSEAALELIKRGHRLVSDDVVEIRKVSDETLIRLEDWDKEKKYDRLGLEENFTEYLGNKIVCHNIPIRPGRNLAIICESAAVNYRQKKMGYNAAQELYQRVQNSLSKPREDDEE